MAWANLGISSTTSSKTASNNIGLGGTQPTWDLDETLIAAVVCDNTGTNAPTVSSISKPASQGTDWVQLAAIPSATASAAGSVVGYLYAAKSTGNYGGTSTSATLSASVAVRIGYLMRDIVGGTTTARASAADVKGTALNISWQAGDLLLLMLATENNAAPSMVDGTFGGDLSSAGWTTDSSMSTTGGGATGNAGFALYYQTASSAGSGSFTYNPSADGGAALVALQQASSLTSVQKSLGLVWNVKAGVQKSLQILFNVQGTVTPVQKSLGLLWNVRAGVQKSLATSWNIRAGIQKSLGLLWNARAGVQNSLSLLWNVLAGGGGPPASFVSSSRSGSSDSNASSNTTPVPAGAASGMTALLAIEIFLDSGSSPITPTWPSGFTEIVNRAASPSNGVQLLVAKKTLNASDTGNYSTPLGASRWNQGVCVLLANGVTVSTPDVNALKNGSGQNIDGLTVDTSAAPVLIHFQANSSAASHTPPTNFTERQEGEYITVATYEPGSPGEYTTAGASQTISTVWAAALIAVEGGTGETLTPVSKPLALSWNVVGGVQKPLALSYNVRAGVQDPLALSWNIRTALQKSLALQWNLRAGVQQPLALLYNVRSGTQKSLTLSYNVRAGVQKSLNTLWNVRAGTQKPLELRWNVLANLSGVQKPLALLWSIGGPVSKPLNLLFNVRTSLSKSLALQWNVRIGVQDPLALRWNVRAGAQKPLALRWNVISGVSDPLVLRWNVRAEVAKALELQWNVLSNLTADIPFKLGANNVTDMRIGTVPANRLYLGADQIWP